METSRVDTALPCRVCSVPSSCATATGSRQASANPRRGAMMTTSLPEPLPDDPLPLAKGWIDEAARSVRNATAMALATTAPDGRPAARMVICRGFDADGGWFVFYTDRTSAKGRDLERLPRAALVFYWEPSSG